MLDILSCIVVVLLSVTLVTAGTMRASRVERSFVLLSLLMHFAFAIANYEIMERVFVISDVHGYLDAGAVVASLIEVHPLHWLGEIFKALVLLPSELEGGTSGNMGCFAGIGLVLTRSTWGTFLLFAALSFSGKWALFRAFKEELTGIDERALAVAIMLVPSCVYWTSGLVKEAFAMGGLGVLFRGLQLVIREFNLFGLAYILYGLVIVGGFKPYFLFAFVIGAGLWLLFDKIKRAPAFAPIILVVGLLVGVGGLVLLGKQFKDYSVDRIGESIATQQSWVQKTEGGTDYAIGDPTQRSLAGQALFAPLALVTTFVRPFPTEARNATSAISALEMLVLTAFLARALVRVGIRGALRVLLSKGVLVFVLAFLLVGGAGVGLATTNLGSLSRYRTPLLPFYALVIVVLRREVAARAAVRRAIDSVASIRGGRGLIPRGSRSPRDRRSQGVSS